MPATTSYDVVGNREDKLDILTTVSPEKTPLISSLPKARTPEATLVEWQTDDYENVDFDGVIEGSDQTSHDDKARNRELISNRIQEFRKSYAVTDIQEKVKTAGVPSEVDRAKAKAMMELKQSCEAAVGGDNDLRAGTGGQTALLRGLGSWIDSANANIPASVRTPAASIGTTSSLTEPTFNDVLQSTYDESGEVNSMTLFAGSILKRKITNFTRAEGTTTPTPFTVNSTQGEKKIIFSVMFYEGDFGMVKIVNDPFLGRVSGGGQTTQSKSRGYLIPDGMANLAIFKEPFIFEQSDEGGGPRGFAKSIKTLIVKNPKGLGKFA